MRDLVGFHKPFGMKTQARPNRRCFNPLPASAGDRPLNADKQDPNAARKARTPIAGQKPRRFLVAVIDRSTSSCAGFEPRLPADSRTFVYDSMEEIEKPGVLKSVGEVSETRPFGSPGWKFHSGRAPRVSLPGPA